jgi:hypothetical protein
MKLTAKQKRNIKAVGVSPMYSKRSGRAVANQYKIYIDGGVLFQSYNVIIAAKMNDGGVYLDANYWNYSRTTGKYRNQFLNEYIEYTREQIKNGNYKLTNLN